MENGGGHAALQIIIPLLAWPDYSRWRRFLNNRRHRLDKDTKTSQRTSLGPCPSSPLLLSADLFGLSKYDWNTRGTVLYKVSRAWVSLSLSSSWGFLASMHALCSGFSPPPPPPWPFWRITDHVWLAGCKDRRRGSGEPVQRRPCQCVHIVQKCNLESPSGGLTCLRHQHEKNDAGIWENVQTPHAFVVV